MVKMLFTDQQIAEHHLDAVRDRQPHYGSERQMVYMRRTPSVILMNRPGMPFTRAETDRLFML